MQQDIAATRPLSMAVPKFVRVPSGTNGVAMDTNERIYLSPPEVLGDERERVMQAIDDGWLAPVGPDLNAFEAELADTAGVAHAAAVASGTAGLHLALHANEIGVGDEVIVSSLTFIASANAVVYTGATPIFVDSDASWNADPDLVLELVEQRRPAAVVITDLYGQCADFPRFTARCEELGVLVVEDAAEAIGASAHGQRAGSFGDIGVLSFNGNKLITTTSGGAVVTNNADDAGRIRHLATQARQSVAHYEHLEVGFNYRMSNLLAAFGRAQLATLPERIARRGAVRTWYESLFADIPGTALNPIPSWSEPNHWLTCVTIDQEQAGFSAGQLLDAFAAANVEARPIWKPLHLQPVFEGCIVAGGAVSESIFTNGVTLPSGGYVRGGGWHDRIEAVIRSCANP